MGIWSTLFGPREPEVWPVRVGDDNYQQEVLRSGLPVLLDIWGPDCGPCKQLEPIVLKLAKRYNGRVKVAEMNAEAAPRTLASLGVRGTPTVLYYRKGAIVERVVGFRGELYHDEIIRTELLGEPAQAG
jgi:thioredoxin-like negative regulator of GroEL